MLFLTGTESWHVATLDEPALVARFQDARHVFVDESGHWVQHDQLDTFVDLVDEFLT